MKKESVFPMPNTSLLRLRQRLLYETLRERDFDPSLRDATRSLLPRSGTASSGHRATRSLLPRSGTASSGQAKSVQVPNA
ncbi:MAG: hypothetical protein ACYT04_29710 [Nostoc sp.]